MSVVLLYFHNVKPINSDCLHRARSLRYEVVTDLVIIASGVGMITRMMVLLLISSVSADGS